MSVNWQHLPARLGVAGVPPHERLAARRWSARLEVLVGLATLWLPFIWYAEVKRRIDPPTLQLLDLAIWSVFLLETLVLSVLVHDRRRYWRQNWLNLLIVLGGMPLLWWHSDLGVAMLRMLRLALLLVVVVRMARNSMRLMARHALSATLIAAVFLVGSIGTLVASIEPNFQSVWDGLW